MALRRMCIGSDQMNSLDRLEVRTWFHNQRRTIICIRLNSEFKAYFEAGRSGQYPTPQSYQSRLTFKGLSPREQLLHWRNKMTVLMSSAELPGSRES